MALEPRVQAKLQPMTAQTLEIKHERGGLTFAIPDRPHRQTSLEGYGVSARFEGI